MLAYVRRLLDSKDTGADTLVLGVFLGFMNFVFSVLVYLLLFAAQTIWPQRIHLDSGGFVTAMVGLGGMYSAVLGATTAAYRWRKPPEENK